jgi:hypothetical protein
MTSLANNGNKIKLLTPQSELEEKKYITCLNKKFKTFMIEDFFHLPTDVNDTGGVP